MLPEDLISKVADRKIPDIEIEADFWKIVATSHGDRPTVEAALDFIREKRPDLAKRLSDDFDETLNNNIGQEDENL